MYRKALIGSAIVIASLVAAIGIVYAFGTPMQTPVQTAYSAAPTSPEGAASATPQGAMSAGGAPVDGTVTDVPEGGVPAPDENAPLAIQIPGCTCHSDDPKLVEQHSKYRMNQCAGCHGGKTPTGQ